VTLSNGSSAGLIQAITHLGKSETRTRRHTLSQITFSDTSSNCRSLPGSLAWQGIDRTVSLGCFVRDDDSAELLFLSSFLSALLSISKDTWGATFRKLKALVQQLPTAGSLLPLQLLCALEAI
jgi:hypothetical protein